MIIRYDQGNWFVNGNQFPSAPVQVDTRSSVPMVVAEEAYKAYAKSFGTSQSLKTINERGGFGTIELICFLYERIKHLEQGQG